MADPLRLTGATIHIGSPDGQWHALEATSVDFDFTPPSEPVAPEKPIPMAATFEATWDVELTESAQRMFARMAEAARRAEEAVFAEALEKGWGVLQVGFWDVDPHRDPEDHVYRGGIRSLATPLIPAGSRWYFHDLATARRALRLDDEEDLGASQG